MSSVVAAGEAYGPEAIQIALSAKLTRVIWLPALVWIGAKAIDIRTVRTLDESRPSRPGRRFHVPWFIALFLIATLLSNFRPGMDVGWHIASEGGTAVLNLVFFLMGADISRLIIAALTQRPVMQAALLWAVVNIATLLSVL